MFASIAWMEIVGILLGGIAQNSVFGATTAWMKNFVFLVDAGFYALLLALVM